MLPFILLSGLMVKTESLKVLKPLTYLSYYRFGFETMMTTLYGFGRCQKDGIDESMNPPVWIRLLTMVDETLEKSKNETKEQSAQKVIDSIFYRKDREQYSAILNDIDLRESEIGFNICMLVILVAIWGSVAFLAIRQHIRKT